MTPSDLPLPASTPVDGRTLAWNALAAWETGDSEFLTDTLDNAAGDARELGLARELVLGAVRHQRLYDWLADRFLRPGVQPPVLRRALRLAAHQLFALDRIPPYAVGDATINLLRTLGHDRLTGVANAVVRRLAGLRQDARLTSGPLGRLAPADIPSEPGLRHSLPDALLTDLAARLADVADTDAALAALNVVPALCTRTRPGLAPPHGRSVLRQEGVWTWWEDPAEALVFVGDGRCVVQDHTQGRLVDLAQPRASDLVLDVCAAPGGKALSFAERGCRVVATDRAVGKLPSLSKALGSRLASGNGAVLAMDGLRPALLPSFDVVVVDAPCSNTGVLGRKPEARWRYDRKQRDRLTALQSSLLTAASRLVKPGGRLVYGTCSVVPDENQGIAHRLDGWRLRAEEAAWPDAWHAGGYTAVLVRS